ncbi:MAG: AAA family ATPase [Candidatus Omnitrophica bacterium]|nr:AAA family ATPase [Candidatus Omnitrophota bacterium]
MRIIAITNQKGGCGKTTTALNLAACLAANDRKVLLIDLDPQSHATLGLNVAADLSMYNVLSKVTPQKAKLNDIIQHISPNFDLAPSSVVLSILEQELAGEIGRESQLWELFNEFQGDYNYILIDCPPNLGLLTVNALRATSEILIPVEASRFSLEGLSQLLDIINLVRERLNHTVNYRVLVANFDSRLRHSFAMLEKIKSTFNKKLFSTIIHVNVKLKEAQNHGTHILNYDKYSRGAKDYSTLARELIMEEYIPEATALLEGKMREALQQEIKHLSEVAFYFKDPQAKEVYIAGDFNNWKTDESSRMEFHDGAWIKKMALFPGRYRYRFVADGRWIEDPHNPTRVMNPYGQMDSLVEI